ncbi:hypothetical protein BDZ91DRAFT_790120 [Kalaharituber pfeilii]|nr:hypothetical protein BDZ91DRAFT_790120 [Kalaharituber pfeilii]
MTSTARVQPIQSKEVPPNLHALSRIQRQQHDSISTVQSRRSIRPPGKQASQPSHKSLEEPKNEHYDYKFAATKGPFYESCNVTSTTAKPERRISAGMGLREQEQHMVKIGRENWALKIDVTLLKKKRDELGAINEKLVQRVEALSKENKDLKQELKRTEAELKAREGELDEAGRACRKLRKNLVMLKKKLGSQNQGSNGAPDLEEDSKDAYSSTNSYGLERTDRIAKYGRSSPSIQSRISSLTSQKRSSKSQKNGTIRTNSSSFCLQPPNISASSLCSIPRHVSSDEQDGKCSSDGAVADEGEESSDNRHSDFEYEKNNGRTKAQQDLKLHPREDSDKVSRSDATFSNLRNKPLRRRILKFNRCEEPDTSDSSSGEENFFDSDFAARNTSLPLTPMTMSPEPSNQSQFPAEQGARKPGSPNSSQNERKPPFLKRLDFAGSVDVGPIDQRSVVSATVPLTSRYSLFQPGNQQSPHSSNSFTRLNECISVSRIPSPCINAAQRRRRHLDPLSKLMVAKELLTRKCFEGDS